MASWIPLLQRSGSRKSSARTTPSVLRSPKLPSTTLTNCSTRTMCAAPNVTTPLLQSAARSDDRPTIDRSRREQASRTGLGDRKEIGGRQGAADHLLHPAFNLLAALGEGVHDHGE